MGGASLEVYRGQGTIFQEIVGEKERWNTKVMKNEEIVTWINDVNVTTCSGVPLCVMPQKP